MTTINFKISSNRQADRVRQAFKGAVIYGDRSGTVRVEDDFVEEGKSLLKKLKVTKIKSL